jgi:predicted dehydrogenase
MRPVGFGILGCGGIGRWHARQLATLEGTRLVAMADPEPKARERAARDLAVPVLADPEALLADPEVEIVSICTPPATHLALALSAAAAGKHLLIEKPLALDVAGADQVLAACSTRDLLLGVVHQQRTQAACRAVKRLVEESSLGTLQYAVASLCWYRPQEVLEQHAWRGRDPGGGLLLDAGIHLIDLLLWLMGPAAWVSGYARDGARPANVTATIGFRSGAGAAVALSFAGNLFRDDIAIDLVGTRGGCRLEIRDHDHAELVRLDLAAKDGERASRQMDGKAEELMRAAGGGWRDGPRQPLWRAASRLLPAERGRLAFTSPISYLQRWIDRKAQAERGQPQGHAAVLAGMAAALRGGLASVATGVEARDGLLLIEALEQSGRSGGGRVELAQPRPGP